MDPALGLDQLSVFVCYMDLKKVYDRVALGIRHRLVPVLLL